MVVMVQVRKGLLGWLYPEAHDVSDNMGGGLDAVYDKATGKWIFPDVSGDSVNMFLVSSSYNPSQSFKKYYRIPITRMLIKTLPICLLPPPWVQVHP